MVAAESSRYEAECPALYGPRASFSVFFGGKPPPRILEVLCFPSFSLLFSPRHFNTFFCLFYFGMPWVVFYLGAGPQQLWQECLLLFHDALPTIVAFMALLAVGAGLSLMIAFIEDVVNLLFFHMYCFYVYAATIYRLQLRILLMSWRLVCGGLVIEITVQCLVYF